MLAVPILLELIKQAILASWINRIPRVCAECSERIRAKPLMVA